MGYSCGGEVLEESQLGEILFDWTQVGSIIRIRSELLGLSHIEVGGSGLEGLLTFEMDRFGAATVERYFCGFLAGR